MADSAFPSPLEFFETPREAIEPLIPFLNLPRVWVDLGCGRGALGKALYAAWGIQGVGIEFLPERAEQAMNSGAYAAVIRGDVANREDWKRVLDAATKAAFSRPGRSPQGWCVIANPPFAQWELFADRAIEGAEQDGEAALLLPAMAFERRKTRTQTFTKRALHIEAENVGRYDLADRPAFHRVFIEKGTDKPYIDQKGDAPMAYAWWMKGERHAGKWRWLKSVRRNEPDAPT